MKTKLEELHELFLAGDEAIARICEIEKRPLMGIAMVRDYAEVFSNCLEMMKQIESQLPEDFEELINFNETLISANRKNGGAVTFQTLAEHVTIKS